MYYSQAGNKCSKCSAEYIPGNIPRKCELCGNPMHEIQKQEVTKKKGSK